MFLEIGKMSDMIAIMMAKMFIVSLAVIGMYSLISELINGTLPL